MPDPKLHIVAFDIPYPADYGGAIDIFYKIKHLSEAGCEIYLHCFEYRREQASILNEYCKEVFYYPRLQGIKAVSLQLPYITYSRRNNLLLQRLIAIDAPVLFEGIHSTFYLSHPSLKRRYKIVRTHNVEHDYYYQLYLKEKSLFRKIYFRIEAHLLKKYERSLDDADAFFALSIKDKEYFQAMYPGALHEFIAPFHPFETSEIPTGLGGYCLYHGNLSHPENEEAVLFLLSKVIPFTDAKFIIAGKSPTGRILEYSKSVKNCELISNPEATKMKELIHDAHIHVLPTFQSTGMKLKLLYALFNGRHVIANSPMLYGTRLNEMCIIADTAEKMADAVRENKQRPFAETEKQKRAELLEQNYNNRVNARRIVTFLQQKSL